MTKDPAFLFYSQDFLVGTLTMPYEDKGKYITILCYMHQHGPISDETIRLLVGNASDILMSKFTKLSDGLWHNERLEIEVEKRNKFTKSRKNNGQKGGRPPKNQSVATDNNNVDKETTRLSVDKAKNNLSENENDNVNDNKVDSKTEEEISREKKFCDRVLKFWGFDEIKHNGNYRLMYIAYRHHDARGGIQHFIDQCENYLKFIEKTNGYRFKHGFENFIGSSENCYTGSWNSENWEQKLSDAQIDNSNPKPTFPGVWDQNFYLKSTAENKKLYEEFLKEKIGGRLDWTPTGYPVWKYAEKPKSQSGFIMQGLGNIGKEKRAS